MGKNYGGSNLDAGKMNNRKLTTIMIPIEQCNLSCAYCYNTERSGDIMDDKTLYATFEKVLDYNGADVTTNFIWHGSEPLLAGKHFYENVIKIQKDKFSRFPISNNIQTNGVLVTPEFIKFFAENDFHLGISIDGPQYIHDKYRRYADGKETFSDVMRGIDLTKKTNVDVGALGVLTKSSAEHIGEVYDFFKAEKLDFDLLPFAPGAKDYIGNEELGLTSEDYSNAAIKLFDLWLSDSQPLGIRSCDSWALAALGVRSPECTYSGDCLTKYITVGPSGDVWPCNRFYRVDDFKLGNILTDSLSGTIIPKAEELQSARQKKIESSCGECQAYVSCQGGCPSQAFAYKGDYQLKDSFCEAYKTILQHADLKVKTQLENAGFEQLSDVQSVDWELVEHEKIQSPVLRKLVSYVKEVGDVQALDQEDKKCWRDKTWKQWRDWRIF
jgi:uncharacterized protein